MKRDIRRLLDHLADVGRLATLRDPLSRLAGADVDLTPPQLHAVMWLATDGPLPMAVLSQRMGCSGPTATGVVDRLENLGLVERKPKPGDRRVVLVAASRKGRELAARLEEVLGAQLDGLLGMLSGQDRKELIAIVGRLVKALREAQRELEENAP